MEIFRGGNESGLRFSVRRLGGRGFSAVNHLEGPAQGVCLKTSALLVENDDPDKQRRVTDDCKLIKEIKFLPKFLLYH